MAWSDNEWQSACFIDEREIDAVLAEAAGIGASRLLAVVDGAGQCRGLGEPELAALAVCRDREVRQAVLTAAGRIKDKIYGRRVVIFAPLYISDYCVNDCAYCGYRVRNRFARRRLTEAELRQEVRILEGMGHKRLAVEAGEDDVNCPLSYI
ncbi:MAG: [FeFe] hydrogenase H-cluster radical SAM maturase HydG, partial [Negativicutes bacterium]|nr:[FeFe] hydrogenase H-cluster radical SAM maturase HydG [Negativicutes bacterium]